jgi:hypothetical protein
MEQAFFLRRGDLLALQGCGTRVAVSGGDAWITQYGDLNDYVVHEGNWEAKSDGLVLVHALQFSLVDVTLPPGAKAQLRRRGELQTTLD